MSDGMSEAFGPSNRAQREASKKYIVLYVVDNVPKIKRFVKKNDALAFANKIKDNEDFNNWVEYIIKGRILKDAK